MNRKEKRGQKARLSHLGWNGHTVRDSRTISDYAANTRDDRNPQAIASVTSIHPAAKALCTLR